MPDIIGSALTCIERTYCDKLLEGKPLPPGTDLLAISCRCKSQFCQQCSLGRMVAIREKLRPIIQKWQSVQLVTLTVDPKAFKSPLEAWKYVGKKRAISVLMRALRRSGSLCGREWVCALEFHKSGWPHWHVLTHSRFIPHRVILAGWKLGHVSISRSRGFESMDHATHYVTKYVSKFGEVPAWVLDYRGNLRRFSSSRGLFPFRWDRTEPENQGRGRKRRTARERVQACGEGANLFLRLPVLGGHKYRFLAKVTAETLTEPDRREDGQGLPVTRPENRTKAA